MIYLSFATSAIYISGRRAGTTSHIDREGAKMCNAVCMA
jgi:hypothetical protein